MGQASASSSENTSVLHNLSVSAKRCQNQRGFSYVGHKRALRGWSKEVGEGWRVVSRWWRGEPMAVVGGKWGMEKCTEIWLIRTRKMSADGNHSNQPIRSIWNDKLQCFDFAITFKRFWRLLCAIIALLKVHFFKNYFFKKQNHPSGPRADIHMLISYAWSDIMLSAWSEISVYNCSKHPSFPLIWISPCAGLRVTLEELRVSLEGKDLNNRARRSFYGWRFDY